MLQEFHEAARRAHYWTSFDPEKRGVQTIETYEQVLADDLKIIKDARQEVKDLYVQRFKKHFSHWLSARSRCYSVMITGGSNFNNRRHEKYNNWERSAYEKFDTYRTKAIAGILKQIEREKPEEQKEAEALEQIRRHVADKIATIISIDNGNNRYTARQLIVSNLTGFINRMANNGQVDHVEKALQMIRKANENRTKPIITAKNSVWKAWEKARQIAAAKSESAARENNTEEVNGIEIVRNFQADRLQLIFPDKPEDEVRRLLKSNGFRWSPRYGAWQRQLTNNAEWAAKRVLNQIHE